MYVLEGLDNGTERIFLKLESYILGGTELGDM